MDVTKSVLVLCIVIVCFLPVVNAEKVFLKGGESILVSGKNITFIGVSPTEVNFEVDGVRGGVELNISGIISGVNITALEFSRLPLIVIAEFRVDFTCGDGTCSDKEDHQVCCKDCGCLESSKACVNNQCGENITIETGTYECNINEDCDDNNACSLSSCDTSVVPYKCKATAITTCVSGDGCCPVACDTKEDADCTTVDKCTSNEECDDNNACTTDACSGTPKRCVHTQQQGCSSNDQCVPHGTIYNNMFCAQATNMFELQRSNDVSCVESYECITGTCSKGTCGAKGGALYRILIYVGVALILIMVVSYAFLKGQRKD